jgi:hypothetical protein
MTHNHHEAYYTTKLKWIGCERVCDTIWSGFMAHGHRFLNGDNGCINT